MKVSKSKPSNVFSTSDDQKMNSKERTKKRKPSLENESNPHTKTTWVVDQASTSAILEDMGVSMLDEDSQDAMPEPTPPVYTNEGQQAPNAPRLPLVDVNSCSTHTPQTPKRKMPSSFKSTESFLCKRAKVEYTEGSDHWNMLSDEMVLNIFSWIPKPMLVKVARVCKRWERLSFDESLWRRMDLAGKVLKEEVLGRILDRGPAILRLAKAEISAPIWPDVGLPYQRFCKVQYLDLSMAVIDTIALEQLMAACTQIKKLSLENCELNDKICEKIGENNNIEVINMALCQGLTMNGLSLITNQCHKLHSWNLAWTNLDRESVTYLVLCLPLSMLKLNISGCRDTLFDEDITHLTKKCPHLKELDVADATMLTSKTVDTLVGLRGLEYIQLSRCYHIMPSAFTSLRKILTLLALDVFGMLKDSALQQLKESMPSIQINKFPFSSIARPTTGVRRTSLWGLRSRDNVI